jgi:hypothetical protein
MRGEEDSGLRDGEEDSGLRDGGEEDSGLRDRGEETLDSYVPPNNLITDLCSGEC